MTLKRVALSVLLSVCFGAFVLNAEPPTVTVRPALVRPPVDFANTWQPNVLILIQDKTAAPTHYAVSLTYQSEGKFLRSDQLVPRNVGYAYDAVWFFVVPADATNIKATVLPNVVNKADVVEVAAAE